MTDWEQEWLSDAPAYHQEPVAARQDPEPPPDPPRREIRIARPALMWMGSVAKVSNSELRGKRGEPVKIGVPCFTC